MDNNGPNFIIAGPNLLIIGNAVLSPLAKFPAILNLSNIKIPFDIVLNKGENTFIAPPTPSDNKAKPATAFIIPDASFGFCLIHSATFFIIGVKASNALFIVGARANPKSAKAFII